MASNITLSAGVRQNLLALQNTAQLLSTTQNRLATGKKVNSALDNPTNFFTSSALASRASDLSNILDSMENGINTLKAADNGLTAITKAVESLKASVTQARQDASWKATSFTIDATAIGTSTAKTLSISGGAVGTTPVDIDLNQTAVSAVSATLTGGQAIAGNYTGGTFSIQAANLNGGAAVDVTIADNATATDVVDAINDALALATGGAAGITASESSGTLTLTGTTGNNITVSGDASVLAEFDFTDGEASTNGVVAVAAAVKTVDELVTAINTDVNLIGKVKATNDGGKLNIQNLSTEDLTVEGATSAAIITGGTGPSSTTTIGGNTVRKNLISQFNDLRNQLDKLADDSSFNGVNLLKGDTLKLVFNEINTSSISIVSQDADGINTGVLSIGEASATEFSSNTSLDTRLDALSNALTQLRSQASAFGSNLSIVQNRQEFTKAMINTLQVGADSLVLADSNEEAANLLALQTRQQLSTTALSLASQADQGVLRLF
jgi:flagellin